MRYHGLVLAAFLSVFTFTAAMADGKAELQRLIDGGGDSSVSSDAGGLQSDDGSIRLTPDKTKIIRLEEDAASVIVTNPAHATVMLDSPRLLVVMPRQPGSTSFTVLNGRGDTIMEKDVIVTAAAQPQYVRVRKMCNGQDNTCVSNSYYYCPDGCYEVMPVAADNNPTEVPEIQGSGGSSEADAGGPVMPVAPERGDAPVQPTEEEQAPQDNGGETEGE